MINPMVSRLVRKDWYFSRWYLVGYLLLGLFSATGLAVGGEGAFYVGSIGLITVLVSLSIHLTMVTVVHERSEHTIGFVMTLPISPREYTLAKMIANLSIFLVGWSVLVVAALGVIAGRSGVPDGLIPFALVIFVQLFAGYCLMLGVALVSESLGWTVGAIVVGNLAVQGVMYVVSNHPEVARDLTQNTIAWRSPVLMALAVELLVIVGSVALTFFLQARKKDFL